MNGNKIIQLGLDREDPLKITGQAPDTEKQPHELRLTVQADRGTKFPCPSYAKVCNAREFQEMTWSHLDLLL